MRVQLPPRIFFFFFFFFHLSLLTYRLLKKKRTEKFCSCWIWAITLVGEVRRRSSSAKLRSRVHTQIAYLPLERTYWLSRGDTSTTLLNCTWTTSLVKSPDAIQYFYLYKNIRCQKLSQCLRHMLHHPTRSTVIINICFVPYVMFDPDRECERSRVRLPPIGVGVAKHLRRHLRYNTLAPLVSNFFEIRNFNILLWKILVEAC